MGHLLRSFSILALLALSACTTMTTTASPGPRQAAVAPARLPPPPTKVVPATIKAARTFCRDGPSTYYPIFQTLTKGASIAVVDSAPAWSMVTLPQGSCWIANRQIKSTAVAAAKKPVRARSGQQVQRRCPCTTARRCTDSRGRRYCLTSAGQRRYRR